VREDEAVGPPLPDEVGQGAVELGLDVLLPDEGLALRVLARFPGQVEQVPAPHLAPRLLDLARAVVIEQIPHVRRSIAAVALGIRREKIQVFAERQQQASFAELLLESGGDALEALAREA